MALISPWTCNDKHIAVHRIAPLPSKVFFNTGCAAGSAPLMRSGLPIQNSLGLHVLQPQGLVLDVRLRAADALPAIGVTEPMIRVEFHNRITLARGFESMAEYTATNPPVYTVALSDPTLAPDWCTSCTYEDHDLVVRGLRVPMVIPPVLAPDAMISVQYLATKNPSDHILVEGASLLDPDPGHDLLYGFILLPMEELLRGTKLRAHIYPVGQATVAKRVRYTPADDALCIVEGLLEGADGLRSQVRFQTPSHAYLDILTHSDVIAALMMANEDEMTRELVAIRPSKAVPEAFMCWEHMMMTEMDSVATSRPARDGIFLNGHYFNMLPHPSSPLHFGSRVVLGLFHMALLARHVKEPRLLLELPASLLTSAVREVLRWSPHLCSAQALFDLELGRLRLARSQHVHDMLMDLAIMAGACLIRHGTYCPDEAIVMRRHRPEVVASDYYAGWEASDRGFVGDCEDKHTAIIMLLSYIEHDGGGGRLSAEHPLLAEVVAAVHHYLFLTAIGTAHAARLGAAAVSQSAGSKTQKGEAVVDGVRVGIQGHIFAIVVPKGLLAEASVVSDATFNGIRQEHALQAIGEGTTAQDSRNRPDPNPRPTRVLVEGLLRANAQALELLGLTSNAIWTFAPPPGTQDFYDAVSTTVGMQLHEVVDPSPKGRGRRVTAAAVTMLDDDGARRVGVPMTIFLDPSESGRRQLQLTPVGWESDENLERMASVNMMMPARIVPTPSPAPGVRTDLADIPEHLRLLHRSQQGPDSPIQRRRRADLQPDFVVFNIRLDRTNANWAKLMLELVSKVEAVCSLDVYVENIFKGLRGACVVVGLYS